MALPGSVRDREYQSFVDCNGNTAKRVKVCNSTSDAIPVFITEEGAAQEFVLQYNEVNSLAAQSEADLLTYTVPIDKELIKASLNVSGENIATYTVLLNDDIIAKKRTTWTRFNTDFFFDHTRFNAGDEIKVKVFNERDSISNFNITIEGVLNGA